MPEKVALIGPNPLLEGGTPIPFKLFCDYLNSNYSKRYRFCIISSSSNPENKSAKPLELFKESWRILRTLGAGISCDTLIVFGSQRFTTITGSVLMLVYKPLRRKIYIRYIGGACDVYYEQSHLVLRWLMRRVLSHADAIVVETEMLLSNMTALWGDKVFSAPNYRTFGVGHVQERLFRSGSVSFIYVGLVRKLKGLEELLAAFVKLSDRLSKEGREIAVELDIYGPMMTSKLEPLDISRYLDNSNIRFHGRVSNRELLYKYYRSDVFVYPTYWPSEGHPGAVIEALQCGLPIISSSWRAMPEIVVDEYNGLVCEPRSVDGLIDVMHRICCDLPLRKRLSVNAAKTAAQYESENICERMANIFELCPDETEKLMNSPTAPIAPTR